MLICGFLWLSHNLSSNDEHVLVNKEVKQFQGCQNCRISEFNVRVCIKYKAHNPCSNFLENNCRYYIHSSSLVLAQLFIQQGWLWTKVMVGKEYRSNFPLLHAVTTMYQSIFKNVILAILISVTMTMIFWSKTDLLYK